MSVRGYLLTAIAVLGIAALGIWWLSPSTFGDLRQLLNRDALEQLVEQSGLWGPLVIIGLMILAVVASPLPSAPIAMAAGAAYGHVWGTVQVVIGAEIGALIAFGLARVLGHDTLRRVFGEQIDTGLFGSQNALTGTVFVSRLMPFLSFDLVSYAAGLSNLHAWRFALATLAGIIPASFLIAHVGAEAVSGDMGRATWAVLGLGLVTGLPILWVAVRQRGNKKSS
ncbi:Uncharacterized membrane protein YdjX, TVP38/TMEM64 family, SNARE-associated domain [Sulfitobacter brevis]|uniref:TVP38/TMEM64 family membrane protein n=1 Tax=Sulfitobacter brevis TaxID=74348 RepID=A0A1I2BEF7_9RHOB|nr:VTT domain-containing protein [Sulfitobacter brevis]SFE53540.1 Uncharacterized membrane protein YdjX, TVP38/TMEM64 family, SNARE-associated domain [Sulfitobacter brevis]